MTTLKFIIALVAILLIADFGVRNNAPVLINYHFGFEREVPLFLVMLVSVFIGFIIAWIAEHLSSLKIKSEAKKLRKRNDELESELAGYREKELIEPEAEEMGEIDDAPYSLPEETEEN